MIVKEVRAVLFRRDGIPLSQLMDDSIGDLHLEAAWRALIRGDDPSQLK